MQNEVGRPRSEPLEAIATSLGRVRCPQPSRIERLQQSLARHGQLSCRLLGESKANTGEDGSRKPKANAKFVRLLSFVPVRRSPSRDTRSLAKVNLFTPYQSR